MKNYKRFFEEKKEILNVYNFSILGCGIIILISLYILFQPVKIVTPSGLTVVQTNVKETENIAEDEAKKVAVEQFKELKENVRKEEVNIQRIQREGEEYFYITSQQNSLEIKIKGGTITRINTMPVKE